MNFAAASAPHFCNETRLSVVGSFGRLTLPRDFFHLLREGVLVDPRNNSPMEMDAYSVYLALKAIEQTTGRDYASERETLCNAVLRRMQQCGGFWSHGSWTGSTKEIHMRFTAAAIRLLTEAVEDGFITNPTVVISALKKHLSYSEPLAQGVWFLHDTLEMDATGVPHPQRRRNKGAFGSSLLNCMVLNTHVDTLSTILNVLGRVKTSQADRNYLVSQVNAGLAALARVIHAKPSLLRGLFCRIDSSFRGTLFRAHSSSARAGSDWIRRKLKGAILRLYFPVRHRLRARLPGFAFYDGYLERDIALVGTSFEYHLVNVYDLARLLLQVKEAHFVVEDTLLRRCEALVDRGLDYAVRSSYWNFLMESTEHNTRAVLLCEAMLARLATRPTEPVPQNWQRAYCAIRRLLPPSPALLGYDPFTVAGARFQNGCDLVRLRNGRQLTADLTQETFSFDDHAAPAIANADAHTI